MDDHLDILGQQPLLKIYTQICFCFSVADPSSHSAIIETLTKGLGRLSASFPWVAGQVVNEGARQGNSGVFKFAPLKKIPRLVVKDLRNDTSTPSMDAMKRANFAFPMLDEAVIAPRKTLPGSAEDSTTPVFLIQANFISGGLLLTFVGQHNAMDMTGQGQIIHLLSKACYGEEFTREEMSSGNLARRNLTPLLDDTYDYDSDSELSRQIVAPLAATSNRPAPPKCTWTYFSFQPASLSNLKEHATKTVTSGYISTDDALSAFIWQSIVRARVPRLNLTAETTFARAVNVRAFLEVPQTYPGLVQNMTYHTSSCQSLVEEPLGSVASQLRSALDPRTSRLRHNTSALATLLARSPDKALVSFTATLDLSTDLMLSSWAQLDCYNLDFNLGLGKPEAIRRPQFDPVESLIYLMPRTLDGEIAVAICLRDEDMDRLRADEHFASYATHIG